MAIVGGRILISATFSGLCSRVAPSFVGENTRSLLSLHPVKKLIPLWRFHVACCHGAGTPSNDVIVEYRNGLPVLSLMLPSRKERCEFTLRPVLQTVGDLLQNIQQEDRGIDRTAIYTTDGARVARSTGIDLLLLDDFKLLVNEDSFFVQPPVQVNRGEAGVENLNEVKVMVQQLYSSMCIEEFQVHKERQMLTRLQDLQAQLEPLEKIKQDLVQKAQKRTRFVLWGGLAYMATQFGVLARLTWWEYSWDIMEPVTYFVTYGSAIAMYAYFILTQQEYLYPDARDRQYLRFFHRHAQKRRFDVGTYNRLKDEIAQAEVDLKRLRDPLQLHLPTPEIKEGN
uniref:Calcium uniporter protein n=1 Tax=Eptatretus burgeri TaxID=7764 RepID=A0A8C4X181_EPTBU